MVVDVHSLWPKPFTAYSPQVFIAYIPVHFPSVSNSPHQKSTTQQHNRRLYTHTLRNKPPQRPISPILKVHQTPLGKIHTLKPRHNADTLHLVHLELQLLSGKERWLKNRRFGQSKQSFVLWLYILNSSCWLLFQATYEHTKTHFHL